ncbi:MAG: hypothetical protein GY729_06515 [Desulfobacteraceae bacterium]|nr:hypothetical protein [Desulfobacteraceae bacterium]
MAKGFIHSFFKIPVTKTIKTSMGFEEQRQVFSESNSLYQKVKRYFETLNQNTDPWADDAPDMTDFTQVMSHWDIKKEQISGVARGLTIQIILFELLACYGVYQLLFGHLVVAIQGFFLFLLGTVAVVCRFWRLQVLLRRRFVFFKDWFLWGMFSGAGKQTPIRKAHQQGMKNE